MAKDTQQFFKGFSKLNRTERLQRLLAMGALTVDDIAFLNGSVDPALINLSEQFVENVIGCFPLPLGIATNFRIDNTDYIIPMAVEETSIIAAASKTAKWLRDHGDLTTEILGNTIIGQIQIPKITDFAKFDKQIHDHKNELINLANLKIIPSIVARGGGVRDLTVRKVPRRDGADMAIVHVLLDTCDAMGANLANQVCEFLKEPIQEYCNEKVGLCILSNLVDTKLTVAKAVIRNIDPELGNAIAEASLFAEFDPYRAATSNKGVLNGMDSVLVATGNDWRAVEAGVHAYAARSGQYRAITHWEMQGNDLIGTLRAPIIVGTVGGVTTLHPSAKMCMRMLKITNAEQLSRIVAAVGLVQNLGAIRALSTQGIVDGHMKLHMTNLLLSAGATQEELPMLQKNLQDFFKNSRRVTLSDAKVILAEVRATNVEKL